MTKTMTRKLDLAYMAGFLDGEGCLGTSIYKKEVRGYVNLGIVLIVTNTNKDVLDWMKQTLRVGRVEEKKYESHRKTRCWAFVLSSNKFLLKVLQDLRPFICVKQAHFGYALTFLESRCARNLRTAYNDKELEALFYLRLETQRQPGKKIFYRKKTYSLQSFKAMVADGRSRKYHMVEWTDDMLDILGTNSDSKVAAKLGLDRTVVARKRYNSGIKPYASTRDTSWYDTPIARNKRARRARRSG